MQATEKMRMFIPQVANTAAGPPQHTADHVRVENLLVKCLHDADMSNTPATYP